ncbi:MAG: hypothetical protein LBD31_02830 [Treponema sp.]|jgi:hypothetical protein|nr:hypothetical protein [Treponema sp.]
MTFNNGFYQVVSAMVDLEAFSYALTRALAHISAIQEIQTKDTLEAWGDLPDAHEYCYGRHLYYEHAKHGIIPFWIGLDITKNATHVVITFEQKLMDSLELKQHIAGLKTVREDIQSSRDKANYIEVRLASQDYTSFCSSEDPQFLIDFINEVLSVL